MDLDLFAKGHVGYSDPMVEQGNASVSIDESGLPEAEDVLWRGVGLGQGEGTDEAVARSAGFVEWKAGDLLGCGMDLLVVVAMQLLFQDSANLFPGADSLQGTSADDAVLEPAVGPFDLALGLGRESRAGSWRDWACVAKARAPKWAIRRHNVSHPRGPTQ